MTESVLLFIRLHTLVQLDDMTPDEPHEIREVRHSGLVSNVVEHVLVVHYKGRVRVSHKYACFQAWTQISETVTQENKYINK